MASDFLVNLLSRYYRARFALVRPGDFVLTGIPRSGTSLLSTLLCEPTDCFCFNEIFYDIATLPYLLRRMKKKLIAGLPVPVKMNIEGELTTDTIGGEVVIGKKSFPPKAAGLVVGSNVNVPYLDRIGEILAYRYKLLVVVRDPVYALASWNSPKADLIPEAHLTDGDMNPRWRRFRFDSAEKESRQADIWEHYASLIVSLGGRAKVVRYEDMCDEQQDTMPEIYDFLGVTPPSTTTELKNLNVDDRFGDLERIRELVAERCPSRLKLGYGTLG